MFGAAGLGRTCLHLRRQNQRKAHVLRESLHQKGEDWVSRGLGGIRHRVQLSGFSQLGVNVSRGFRVCAPRGRQRVYHRGQHRPSVWNAVVGRTDFARGFHRSRATRDTEQQKRCTPPFLLVEQRSSPGLGRFSDSVSDALCRGARLCGSAEVASRFQREGSQCHKKSDRRTGIPVRAWKPGRFHGRLESAYEHGDYAELPAKKIWSWGVDAEGLDWRKALSDNDSAYVELQAGLFRNQETYAFLEPRQRIAFTEYWMPVRETGGISRANLAGVVHLARRDEMLVVSFNTNRKLPAAAIQILDGTASLLTEKGDFAPERVWQRELRVPNADRRYRFELKNSGGDLLLGQTEDEYDWTPESEVKVGPQTGHTVPEETRRTEDDWLQLGKTEELDGNNLAALQTYQKGLAKFPANFELLKAAGRLDAILYRFEEAAAHLVAAHNRNTTDAEISYYLGIAYEGTERQKQAMDSYQEAVRLPTYRAAAALRLGELQARAGALLRAQASITQSLGSAPDDLRAAEEFEAVSRALGKTADTDRVAKEQLARFPLSDFLREELGAPDLAHLAADPYRVLNVASEYARLGLYGHPTRPERAWDSRPTESPAGCLFSRLLPGEAWGAWRR